ncbi:MAG: hypothetical protein KY452_00150 [Actinobacteria bacterium]|nr:hypothetical protein [Actinomycetota bacterium]
MRVRSGLGLLVPVLVLVSSVAACGGDEKAPAISATVAVRDNAFLVAVGHGAVWVGSDGVVTRLDPSTGQSTVVEVPGLGGLAVGAGAVWAGGSAGLSLIDPQSGMVTATIPAESSARMVAADSESVWAVLGDTRLTRVNTTEKRLVASEAVAPRVGGLAVGDGSVWASDPVAGELIRLDPMTNTVTDRVEIGVGPRGVAVGEGSVWVANTDVGTITRYDPRANRVATTIEVPDRPVSLAVGEGGVWVIGEDAQGLVSRIDPVTNTVTDQVKVGAPLAAVAAGEGAVWVLGRTPSTLVRIAASTEALARHEPVPTTEAPAIVEYRRSGGIAGFSDVLTVDLSSGRARLGTTVNGPGDFEVPSETLAAVRKAAEDARFPELRSAYRGSAVVDDIVYEVSYRGRTVRASDGAVPERLQPLIRLLSSLVEGEGRS